MDSTLVKKVESSQGCLILDGPSELLARKFMDVQEKSLRSMASDYETRYHEFITYFADTFFGVDAKKIKDESKAQYRVLEQTIYRKVKKKIIKTLSLVLGSWIVSYFIHIGLFVFYSLASITFMIATSLSINFCGLSLKCMCGVRLECMNEVSDCLQLKFLLLKFLKDRVTKKIARLQIT